jgi:hypothetical protein
MPPLLPQNPSSFVRVRDSSSLALPALVDCLHVGGFSETRKTYRAVFSEPKVIIPSTSVVQPAEASDSVQIKSSGEPLPEAELAAVALPASVTAEVVWQTDGRPSKRTRDGSDPADHGTVGRPQKKKRGKKSG